MDIKKFFIVAIFIGICFWCSLFFNKKEPLFGPEYNEERIRIGIPIISDDWNSSGSKNETSWYNPNISSLKESRTPFHYSKYVYHPSGKIGYEIDGYMGYQDFILDDTLVREKIYVTYYYYIQFETLSLEPIQLKNQNWTAQYFGSQSKGFSEEMRSLDEAKIILSSWGLSYP